MQSAPRHVHASLASYLVYSIAYTAVNLGAQAELARMAMEFYADLFTAQPVLEQEKILAHVPVRVSEVMRESLECPFSALEVDKALSIMGANKAPRPDGLTAGFYQTHWETVGPCMTNAVLNFLNGGILPEAINLTMIVLIPKVKRP